MSALSKQGGADGSQPLWKAAALPSARATPVD